LNFDNFCTSYAVNDICIECITDYLPVSQYINNAFYQRCILTKLNNKYDSKCSKYDANFNCIECISTSETVVKVLIGS